MIEVEIKVSITDEQKDALVDGAKFISQKFFTDEYFDSHDYKLTKNGLWLRKRNDKFELKLPATKSGNFNINKNIPMYETTDKYEISDILNLDKKVSFIQALELAGIKSFVKFDNIRTTYLKDNLKIDFDEADFGDFKYNLCEIEVEVESKKQTEHALNKLYKFVSQFGISTERAEGKIGYYIRVRRPAHYFAVKNSKKNVKEA
ncbi:CYTH domain-containing protein [Candidatus Dependentiae bacterium]|nr:CYTH domain-containing protein [Candidatus Dependentiae bacterium]